MIKKENFTRIHNDINGNPRYVIHFLNFITDKDELKDDLPSWNITGKYNLAVKRANKIGGRKYHTKRYGGGIVFQSYSLEDTANSINELMSRFE